MRTPAESASWSADGQLTEVIHPVTPRATTAAASSASSAAAAPGATFAPAPLPAPETGPAASVAKDTPPQRVALVVVVGMSLLAIAFIIMIFVNPTSEAINALAVIAAPIAAMVAAYYGITLSIQQVKNERAEKEKALARAEAAEAISRETEVWSAQMESGLRVAMAKLTAAGVTTSEVTKAAGTPADFF
jgi:hypothetical protein